MKNGFEVRELLEQLRQDKWRIANPFSDPLSIANRVLLHPYSDDYEKQEALGLWLQAHQPCVFGKVSAKLGKVYYCFLTESDLRKSDAEIRGKIQRAKNQWKQWSLTGGEARHSFLLVVTSERVALAAPDNNLKAFATCLRSLFTSEIQEDDEANNLGFQNIYLKNPKDGRIYKFRIIMDFFASAGDGRWWLDHRIPGGLAFSFNSLGHMVKTKEWYDGDSNALEWALKLAMSTIDRAEKHPEFGRATWLLDLAGKQSFKPMACPFANTEKLPPALQGKDWTTYAGFHHSDHNIREEFFSDKDAPLNRGQPFLIDFSYIYTREFKADSELMDGIPISEQELYGDIGKPADWRRGPPIIRERGITRPEEATKEINEALRACRSWDLSGIEAEF